MEVDIKLGWKPKTNVVYVAPIPLFYDFGQSEDENQRHQLVYLGSRPKNSIAIHTNFAMKKQETTDQLSYTYKFPVNLLTVKGKK